jgi:hypothetical protein
MRKLFAVVGYIMWIGAGLFMFFFWCAAMTRWLGFLGSLIAIVISPGLIVFPIVFWIVEGIFPVVYFAIWGLGILGLIVAGIASPNRGY